jgi:hypothetical protein
LTENPVLNHARQCPVCGAADAFVDTLKGGEEFYVECVNCNVYRATRRAFRLFQYLRDRGDKASLARLEGLAARLQARGRGAAAHLGYDDWEEFGTARASRKVE